MISVHRFQTPLIIRWKSGVSVQDFFILSQPAGVNQLLCCIYVQFSDALDAHFAQFCHVNGVFSLPVSFSPSSFVFSPHLSSSLSLCVFMWRVSLSFPGRWWLQSDSFWLHSQAKHQNTQPRWVTLRLLKMSSRQLPDAGQYLAAAAKLDLCADHCGGEPSIC